MCAQTTMQAHQRGNDRPIASPVAHCEPESRETPRHKVDSNSWPNIHFLKQLLPDPSVQAQWRLAITAEELKAFEEGHEGDAYPRDGYT